ncbi:MAG TPA: cytochrome b N-terminal domain-containing protein [Dehalococcoidia bacterium]|nr:cytochrome b N-terminal domain-containing protein [Dehalococcoidia bacterium]
MIKAIFGWLNVRLGLDEMYRVLFKHPVPGNVSGRFGWLYVFGVTALTLFIIQVVTGVLLATTYVPSTAHAYDSLKFITDHQSLGHLLRAIHYYSASAMVLIVLIHMARVFLTASFKYPRELNWMTGVGLFLLVMGMAFTGQLLRWDSDAIGTVLVAAEQAGRVPWIGSWLAYLVIGGQNIGGPTLTRMYALHVFVLPGIIIGIISVHLYLVLKNGISERPISGQPVDPATYKENYERELKRSGEAYFPGSVWKEAAFAFVVVAVVIALALIMGPKPLSGVPDPTDVTIVPRPDWYLLPAYALLSVIPPAIEDYVIVLGPIIVVGGLFLLPIIANRGERSLALRPWAGASVLVVAVAAGVMLFTGYRAPWAPHYDTQVLTAQELGTSDETVIQGAQIFYENGCQFCHGVQGRGGERGPDLTHVRSRMSAQEVVQNILSSPTGMPSFNGKLSKQDLSNILAFLEYEDTKKP